MSIRVKLAVLLSLAIAAAAGCTAAVAVALQNRALRAAEEEKVRLLVASVRTMAEESALARDPLMLLDYLSFVRRDRAEVAGARVRYDGRWQESEPAPANAREERDESVSVPAADGRPEIVVLLRLSRRVLDARLRAATDLLARDVARACVMLVLTGLLVSLPLSWTFTSRLIQIERALASVGDGRLDAAVPERGSDELARLGRGLNAMIGRLRELDDMKRTFVSSITHELRSPLFAIDSYVKMLLRDSKALGDEERKQLARISENAARLAHFVTSLLDMARIERGKLEYRPKTTDLGRLVEDAALFFQSSAADGGKTMAVAVEPGLPAVLADPDLLTQVVTNLVSNALKFTPKGGRVEVSLRRDGAELVCAVTDTGVGIAREALPRLFQPFERVGNSKVGGTGLGLSIAKAMVEMHRGRMSAASEPGKGSRFSFTIPLAAPRGR
ncbi:MAG: HAMP domain-containing histidine kinase [Elusimicrobia bacterium]|nr:HAMP domain-containing histidine kinase [Elusimicrobiota bacterium]